jgi:hypothetical protein
VIGTTVETATPELSLPVVFTLFRSEEPKLFSSEVRAAFASPR